MENIKFEALKKVSEISFKYREMKKISNIDSVSPPSVFIGSKLKYPLMNVGILSPVEGDENAWIYDDMKYWANNNFEIRDVLQLREGLLNSRFKSYAKDVRMNKNFLGLAKEIAIASKPVDVEIELKNTFNIGRKPDRVLTGHGINASLKKAKITGNVKVDRKVDKVINDDIKAVEGVNFLYKNSFDEYTLSKILSVGVLGLKKNKRLVPTRWSITATDDMIAKELLKRVKEYKWIESYELFFGEFLGNQYLIILFPNIWNYELFELYLPRSSWNPTNIIKASTDSETYYGRKTYASNTAGGYYATRLPILEYLDREKRQASVFVMRIETPSYWASLGVWVVRESVRKALANRCLKFSSESEILNSALSISKIKYNFDCSQILKQSKLLSQIKNQKTLSNWF